MESVFVTVYRIIKKEKSSLKFFAAGSSDNGIV